MREHETMNDTNFFYVIAFFETSDEIYGYLAKPPAYDPVDNIDDPNIRVFDSEAAANAANDDEGQAIKVHRDFLDVAATP